MRLVAFGVIAWLRKADNVYRNPQTRGTCWIGAVPDKDGKVHTYSAEPMKP